jgi:hypothetical protein
MTILPLTRAARSVPPARTERKVRHVLHTPSYCLKRISSALQRIVDPANTEFKKKIFALGAQQSLVTNHRVDLSAQAQKRLKQVIDELRTGLEEMSS